MGRICHKILLRLKCLTHAQQQAVELFDQWTHLIRQIIFRHGLQILRLTQSQFMPDTLHRSQ